VSPHIYPYHPALDNFYLLPLNKKVPRFLPLNKGSLPFLRKLSLLELSNLDNFKNKNEKIILQPILPKPTIDI